MKKYFITYGDEKFVKAKERIVNQARHIKWFDSVMSFSRNDISEELELSGLMKISRGGGLWAWKPDVIYTAMQKMNDGDILVYADSGCSLQNCKEWNKIENILDNYDIIAQNIYQSTEEWTRKEIIDYFINNPKGWINAPQHCATTIIIKVSDFSRRLISEWRDCILLHPLFIMDVPEEERRNQHYAFHENRHDQSVYNALIYKYLYSGKIYSTWEHIENYDPVNLQAIRATRLRNGERESLNNKVIGMLKYYFKKFFIRLKWRHCIMRNK